MMKSCIINATILSNGKRINNCSIVYDELILDITNKLPTINDKWKIIDAKGEYVSAGFIDNIAHGYNGFNIMDANEETIASLSNCLLSYGVTMYLPTTLTATIDRIEKVIQSVKNYKIRGENKSEPIGIHLEGSYINPLKKGAQNSKYITPLSKEWVLNNIEMIKRITIAPEMDGAMQLIKELGDNKDLVLSIGHTTATYEQTIQAINCGIKLGTHLYNAMPSINHREPNCTGALLDNNNCYVEIIADNLHLHPAIYSLTYRMKGLDKVILITDSLYIGGIKDGQYELEGLGVSKKNNKITLQNGNLAGSIITLNKAVNNILKNTTYPIEQVILSVTENPAKLIGLYDKIGSVEVGKKADLVIFDDDINVIKTIKNGVVYDI